MPRQFTELQQRIIDANERDICVSAGAGSGKTGVLVERFMRLVTESLSGKLPVGQRAAVSEILVITFTDRATREMKSRIVAELSARGLMDQRRQLETAYISTIHGLCSRLLRENPFEAGVDPNFSIMDEPSAHRLLRQCFDQAIADAYHTADEEISELVADFAESPAYDGMDLNAPAALACEVETVLRKLRGAGVTLEELKKMHAGGSAGLAAYADTPVQMLLSPVLMELSLCVQEIRQMAVRATGTIRAAFSGMLGAVGRMQGQTNVATHIHNIRSMHNALVRAKKIASSSTHSAQLSSLFQRIDKACLRAEFLFDLSPKNELTSHVACHRMIGLALTTWTAYQDAKQRSALMDNDDLQAKCVQLLQEAEHVRRKYRMQFRHLLVDEFQDTNHLQMRLMELLHSTEGKDSSYFSDTNVTRNSLFIVGDVQQSIYGFRNADPDIFHSLESAYKDGGAGLHMQLSENFRSRPEILGLVEQVFRGAFRSDHAPFVPLRSASDFDNKPASSIEVLVTQDTARRDYVHLEADALAVRLKQLVQEDDDKRIHVTMRSDARYGLPVGYVDIAVLLRSLTDISVYEAAFERHGVPAVVAAGGRGYYARYEIQDLLSVLTLLDSPLDDKALLTALRSPFVGADVDTLYRLAVTAQKMKQHGEQRGPLYMAVPALLKSPELPDAERDKIGPFLEVIEEMRKDEDRLPTGLLLERLIRRTNYDLRLVCRPDGRRKLANLHKLVLMAHAEPTNGVREFIKRISDLEMLSDREGDASSAEEGAGAVRFLTIHAAKGLEFPVVVLPDLSRSLIQPETSMFICDPALRALGSRICGEPDAAYRSIVKRNEDSDRSEHLRVLYVAMTRAKEHLILCGNLGRNRGYNWADIVFPTLGVIQAPTQPERRMLNGGIEAMVAPLSSYHSGSSPPNSMGFISKSYELGDRITEALLNGEPIEDLLKPLV